MGAYFSLSKKLDRINANIENRVSEIVSVTAFADSICKEYREEIRPRRSCLINTRKRLRRNGPLLRD